MDITELTQRHLSNATALVGFITLLGGTWARVTEWMEQRSIKAKYQDEIGLAERRIAFLGTWLKAQQEVCTPERFAEIKLESTRELDELRARLTEIMDQANERQGKSKVRMGKTLRRMFLLFLPNNLGGWFFQVAFYILVIFVLWIVSVPIEGEEFTLEYWIGNFVFVNIVFLIPILLLRRQALRFYRKRD
jgi:hypothetical protein